MRLLLNDLEIKTKPPTFNQHWDGINGKTISKKIAIYGHSNFKKFKERIGFVHPKKSQALDELINNLHHERFNKEERESMIINLLKYNPPLTSLEISKQIRMTHIGTIDKLRGMWKRGLLTRKGKYNSKWRVQTQIN